MVDLNQAVNINPEISWVGVTDEKTPFKANSYVLNDGDEAVLFEPGSTLYYAGVRDKVQKVVSTRKIRYILLSHQDPDLCASVPLWEEALGTNQFQIVTHSRTAVLLRHYGIRSKYYLVDQNDWSLTLRSGRKLEFLFTPWCHCPGTFMTYDKRTRFLFSGDVFGALTYDWSLFAGNNYTEAMRGFHEDYMASSEHLRAAMSKLSPLMISQILPQHGSIITQNVDHHIRSLSNLRCGLSLMQKDLFANKEVPGGAAKKDYSDLITFVLERQKGVLGLEQTFSVAREISGLEIDHEGNLLSLKGDGKEILGRLLNRYHERYGHWAVLNCRLALIARANDYKLELPRLQSLQ
ncbi:MAG: MBL fold metallo-hydrolase [Nitrospirae bacterium]|nr:MBL fold metallo-hydrolase [Nitrospirota bacterium]